MTIKIVISKVNIYWDNDSIKLDLLNKINLFKLVQILINKIVLFLYLFPTWKNGILTLVIRGCILRNNQERWTCMHILAQEAKLFAENGCPSTKRLYTKNG